MHAKYYVVDTAHATTYTEVSLACMYPSTLPQDANRCGSRVATGSSTHVRVDLAKLEPQPCLQLFAHVFLHNLQDTPKLERTISLARDGSTDLFHAPNIVACEE
jgi:hypothetical protein